jgi:hypothetical protein
VTFCPSKINRQIEEEEEKKFFFCAFVSERKGKFFRGKYLIDLLLFFSSKLTG